MLTKREEEKYKKLLDGALIKEEEKVGSCDEITMDHIMDFIKAIRPRHFGKPTKVLVVKQNYLDSILSEYGITRETLEKALNCTIEVSEYVPENGIAFDREEVKFNKSHYFANRATICTPMLTTLINGKPKLDLVNYMTGGESKECGDGYFEPTFLPSRVEMIKRFFRRLGGRR